MSQTQLRVFVSSVQKELEDERVTVQNLIHTDPFLQNHCLPFLYEYEPASPDKALDGCLKSLTACDVYVLMVGAEYGSLVGDISITHAEYRRAKEKRLPVLAFIKGDRRAKREDGTQALLKELDDDGFKYKRFSNVIELQKEVRAALVRLLEERFSIAPSSDEDQIAVQTIEATSSFETKLFRKCCGSTWITISRASCLRRLRTERRRRLRVGRYRQEPRCAG
jgi:predicted HTH transcriptional regulator